jgi:Methyltransferase domain
MLMLGLGFLGGFVMTGMRQGVDQLSLGLLVAPVNQAPTNSNGVSDKVVHDESVVGPYYNYKKAHICHENPYEGSLLNGNSFDTADAKALAWMANKSNIRNALYAERSDEHSHAKFNAFEVMAPCHQNCTGECGADTSKIVCGLQQLQKGCIIYSIGGNNQWAFEVELYDLTPCEIHTFDCTGPKERFKPPARISDRHFFHHICMATKAQPPPTTTQGEKVKHTIVGAMETLEGMQTMLGHTSLDLLKMDIEGYEWPIFESWPELTDLEASSKVFLPMQVLVEIHYATHMADLRPKQRGLPWKTELELLELQSRLLKMGYVVAVRDDNRACDHCTELTLLRHKCF